MGGHFHLLEGGKALLQDSLLEGNGMMISSCIFSALHV